MPAMASLRGLVVHMSEAHTTHDDSSGGMQRTPASRIFVPGACMRCFLGACDGGLDGWRATPVVGLKDLLVNFNKSCYRVAQPRA